MTNRAWQLGEPCFIVDMQVSDTFANVWVMPAVVTHIGGVDGSKVTATSFSTAPFGRQFVEGAPFPSEKEAREWLVSYAGRIISAVKAAPLTGMHPGWNIPDYVPKNGDIVCTIDPHKSEILEVLVGIVQLEHGQLKVGYDPSPGNAETSIVRMHRWWKNKADAEAYVRENYTTTFTFLSKEEVAERAYVAVNKIFTEAEVYMQSPEYRKTMEALATLIHNR